ncbi:MAG: aromatic ring-hydroxylating dioxygenase subunit alpha [Planctomycetota bacterium JB042]
MATFEVDPDIRRAHAPAPRLYTGEEAHRRQLDGIFAAAWLPVSTADGLDEVGSARPFTLLPDALDEPLLLVRDLHGTLRCLSNVCTHRGNLIVEGEWRLDTLRCRYHGRRFHLDGTFAYMPCMQGADGFPSERDYLPRIPLAEWRGLLFAALGPRVDLAAAVAPVEERLRGLGITAWRRLEAPAFDLEIAAHWTLVCERALEGFHGSRLHDALTEPGSLLWHPTEVWDHGSVRVALALGREPVFNLPDGHPDRGERVAAFEFHLFPTTFLRVHPWGMVLQTVDPVGPDRTRVRFRVFVAEGRELEEGFAARLRHTAGEDRGLVESVQPAVRSRLFHGGRYSPEREVAVHHFHRQLAAWMAGGDGTGLVRRRTAHAVRRSSQRDQGTSTA